jgi:UDP-GlcNAc:undecaprenyl-phosphate GlcNAc-1-phosphate transferase
MDSPGIRKVHSKPVPRIGGVAIFISVMMITIPVLLLTNVPDKSALLSGYKAIFLLFAASLIFFIGLVDDLQGLKAKFKLISQITAAMIVCSGGIRIDSITITDSVVLNLGIFSWPFTIFWIVGVTNAVNFIDGLDGLAAGICAIACGTIAVLAIYFHQAVLCVMMLALAGSLTGFLFFNFNPAKIFMGDCGSLFLGFTIASATVMCTAKSQALIGFALPLLAMGIPIFDTLFIVLNRFGDKKPVYMPDTEHFHHRLLKLGLKQRHIAVLAYIVTLLATGAGVFLMAARSIRIIIMFGSILVLIILVFHVIGAVSVGQIMRALRRKYH